MSDPGGAQLLSRIGAADNIVALRSLRDEIHEHMEALLSEQPVEQFYAVLNEAHDALIKRAIALAEADLARMGKSPPVPYAYLLFGSGGREEQTLSSDQDSGLIYDDPEEAEREAASQYFAELAQSVVEMLQKLGYPPCEGNVISTNPDWRLSLSEWGGKLNEWFEEPDWERVRYLLIVADSRSIYGESGLAEKLKGLFYTDMLENPVIVRHMLNNTMRHKMLVGVFGQLLRERYGEDAGSLDVKYGAYIPMVNAIRMMSIRAGLRETSTLDRIHSLGRQGKLSAEEASSYAGAFRLFLRLRLMATERSVDGMYTNNGKLSSRKLTKELTDELKTGLRIGKKLQRRVFKQMNGMF